MFSALQALIAPLLAPMLAAIEVRVSLLAALIIRRVVFLIAAALFGLGALVFVTMGVFFALVPHVGPAGAALIMAVIWAMLAGLCVLLSRTRPRVPVAATAAAPAIATPAAAAAPPPPYPPYPPYQSTPPYPPSAAVPPTGAIAAGVPPGAPTAPAGRIARMRSGVTRAAPLLAIGALLVGIVAGRR